MTPRQRVLDSINHSEPDRVPIDFWATGDVYDRLMAHWNLSDKEAVLGRIGADLRYFNGPAYIGEAGKPDENGIITDHWGVQRVYKTITGRRRDGSQYAWSYKHLVSSPLAQATTIKQIEQYNWPTADMWDYSGVKDACLAIRQAGFAVVAGADRLDRTAQLKPAMYIRGADQFFSDLILSPALAECILEHISNYYLEYNRRFFEAADGTIDIFFMGDDMGAQNNTLISPEMYRKFFKKRFAAYCQLAHDFGMKVMYHTCGYVTPLIPDFIDAGVDILQSLQPAAMGDDLPKIKRKYGKVISFQGGIDIQDVLPHGTTRDVIEHVRERAEILAPGGGYIFGTAHNLQPDTPTENILALIEAYHEYGQY